MKISLSRKGVLLIVWIGCLGNVMAQDTLRLSRFSPKQDLVTLASIISTPSHQPPAQVWHQMHADSNRVFKLRNTTIGFTANIYWLGFVLINDTPTFQNKILEIDNPQIDYLHIYRLHGDGDQQIDTLAVTGDKFAFDQRPVLHRNFILPVSLKPGETIALLIEIDKRNSTLNFPVSLWDVTVHSQRDYRENLSFGLFFGMILLCLVYALLAFIFLKRRIYLYYFLWVLHSGIYVFTALGFSLQYLYPEVVNLNSYFRVYLEVTGFLAFIKFTQHFLNISGFFPRMNSVLNGALYLFLAMMTSSVINFQFFEDHSSIVLPFIDSIFLVSGSIVLYSAVFSYKKQRRVVLFFLTAFGMLIAGICLTILAEFGIVPVEHFVINPVMAGSVLELLTFSFALTLEVKKIYDERNELSIKMARQQKDLLRAYVEGVERERERISRELHDDIGSRLSSLKRFVTQSNDQSATLQQQIDILCTDVRTMSHELSPPSLRIAGLRQMVYQLAEETEQRDGLTIDVQFYDFSDTLPEDLTHHLYRITQEALSNIVKHAKATEVDLQFFKHENEWVVTIEDNGKGFDSSAMKAGIGLKNINARVESLGGTLDVSSSPGNGTSMMLRVPGSEPTPTQAQ